MTDREKLVELIDQKQVWGIDQIQPRKYDILLLENEDLADHLIADGVTLQEWIPVAERLPEPFVPVLICREKEPGKRIVEQGFKDLGKWWKVYGTRVTKIISWMPLPQPTKGEQ